MEHADALSLIRAGVAPGAGGVWADLGAGSGVFTRALADLLGAKGRVYAVDRQRSLSGSASQSATVTPIRADFTRTLDLPDLDGILMANALHFVRRHERVLGQLTRHLKPGGAFLLVEYDVTKGSPWIPFPVSLSHFRRLAPRVGLSEAKEVGRRRSRYGPRDIYAAVALREEG